MSRLSLLLLIIFSAEAFAQKGSDEQAIRTLLAAQVMAWNKGNIAGYMHGYWESDSLIFIGKNGPTYGYDATLARYRKAYPDAASMGKLTSAILRLRMLSADYAYVTGSWELKRSAGDLSGYYTLLLRQMKGVWVIIEDHSS